MSGVAAEGRFDVHGMAERANSAYGLANAQLFDANAGVVFDGVGQKYAPTRERSAVVARHLQPTQRAVGGGFEREMERMRLEEQEMSARAQMAHNAAILRERQQGDRWARGFEAPRLAQAATSGWAQEFAGAEESRQQQWANEFRAQQQRSHMAPPVGAWAQEFHAQQGGRWGDEFAATHQNQWADEFTKQEARGEMPMDAVAVQTAKQSSELAATLNADPKFANSKFAQLMAKMGSGEVVVKDDGLREVAGASQSAYAATGERWAQEFAQQQNTQAQWANQYTSSQLHAQPRMQTQQWANEYANATTSREAEQLKSQNVDNWAEEFKHVPNQWAAEFEEIQRNNPQWMENVWDDVQNGVALADQSNYKFSNPNPYLGQSGLQEIAQRLSKDGVLTEAALAAEAWVREDPKNSDAWYALGRIQAENDDDQQAIAAMVRAHEANPHNPNVLLALAVSHANELEQDQALNHARAWLSTQSQFQNLVVGGALQSPEQMLEAFMEAARQAPNDADVQTILGVMAHLTRNYDRAIDAFQRAANLRPEDHSLWNKIGATRANGAESADAIAAYQRALDLKPNYVRAWSNMGIGYANQGRYAESMPYYIRALTMNPNPESPTWGYARISLGCTGRLDLIHHCDSHNIDALRREFPF